MEEIKKKNPIRRFLDWLKSPDEDEFVDGELNIKAFDSEDKDIIQALKKSNKDIDEMSKSFFEENRAKYKNRIKTTELHHTQTIENSEKGNIKVRSSKSQEVQSEREEL